MPFMADTALMQLNAWRWIMKRYAKTLSSAQAHFKKATRAFRLSATVIAGSSGGAAATASQGLWQHEAAAGLAAF